MSSSAAISQSELFGTYPSARRLSPATLGLVVALHGAALGALALRQVAIPAPVAPALMVQVLPAEAPPPTPAPASPSRPTSKPAPTRQALPLALPQLAARSAAPAASEAAPSEPPRPVAPPAAAVPVAPAVSQPRFDADYLLNPAPTYPALSRRLGEEGRVLLRVFVEPNGRPSQIEVKSGSGSARLDQAAEEAVWRWKFTPARRADEAVGAWVQVPVVFNLRG